MMQSTTQANDSNPVPPGASIDKGIRTFLAEVFVVNDDPMALPGDTSLTDSGAIDSMGVLELVMYLEETYGLEISELEMTPENLDTIDNAVRFVRSKLGAEEQRDASHT